MTERSSFNQVLLDSIASDSLCFDGLTWTMFSRGPLIAAYPNFPIGLTRETAELLLSMGPALAALRAREVDLVRLSAPSDSAPVPEQGAVLLPETRIEDLQNWSASELSSQMRRKFRKARLAGLEVQSATGKDAEALHGMYVQTVQRHRTKPRYSLEYFRCLCLEATRNADVIVAKAMMAEDIAGFIALRLDKNVAYYLHGAYSDEFSRIRPGFFTMEWAIQHCQSLGMREFNFLTSPRNQPALRKFKESFGGSSDLRAHWDRALSWSGSAAVLAIKARGLKERLQASATKSTSA